MVTSPELNPCSSETKPLSKIQMAKTLTFTRHEFEDGTTEWIETDTDSDCGPENADSFILLLQQNKTQQQESDDDDEYEIPYEMSFQKLFEAALAERASGGKFGLSWSTDAESDYSSQAEFYGSPEITKDSNYPNETQLENCEAVKENDSPSNNKWGRVRMTTNPGCSDGLELNIPENEKASMEIILEEGREAAREHQAQDPAIKLVFQWANADENGTQTSLGKLNVKKAAAAAAGGRCGGTLECLGTTGTCRWSSIPELACGGNNYKYQTVCSAH